MNDEFAQEISEFETLDELREDIKKSLLKASEVRRQDALRQAALEKLMESTPVVLAESAIKAQAINMAQQLEQRLMTQGISLEQYLTITNSNVEMLLNSIKPDAERQLKTSFILEKLIDEKGIEINDEELDIYINEMAERSGMEVERVRQNLEGMEESIRNNLKMDKALDYLVEHAVVSIEEDVEVEAQDQDEKRPQNNCSPTTNNHMPGMLK